MGQWIGFWIGGCMGGWVGGWMPYSGLDKGLQTVRGEQNYCQLPIPEKMLGNREPLICSLKNVKGKAI